MKKNNLQIFQPMKYRFIYYLISLSVLIPGVYSLITNGFNLSVDFTGGSTIIWQSDSLSEEIITESFSKKEVQVLEIKNTNNSWTLTTSPISSESYQEVLTNLQKKNEVFESKFETIGPSLGGELIRKTLYAISISATLILFYVAFRFKNIQFGAAAIIAMLHDSLILLGVFSLLGAYQGVKIDTLFVTALLTILSFSVHDTIVVYDRIRELKKKHAHLDLEEVVNRAVVETIGRSINNSMTIIFMLFAMYLMGGDTIKWFILALLVGTISGTYSSTFTAAPLLITWNKLFKKKK